MSPIEKTVYCMSWEVKNTVKDLNKDGFRVVTIDYVTRHKVAIFALEILFDENCENRRRR